MLFEREQGKRMFVLLTTHVLQVYALEAIIKSVYPYLAGDQPAFTYF